MPPQRDGLIGPIRVKRRLPNGAVVECLDSGQRWIRLIPHEQADELQRRTTRRQREELAYRAARSERIGDRLWRESNAERASRPRSRQPRAEPEPDGGGFPSP